VSDPPADMIHVPAGPFVFGPGRDERVVELADFWIDAHAVTNREYEDFCAETGRRPPPHWSPRGCPEGLLDLPVVNVTWDDARAFAEHVGEQLPTPAQFEKAARGPDGPKYPWGDSAGLRCANTREAGLGALAAPERFEEGRSPYGCYDMAGNVLHWTRGTHDPERGTRVLKGSSFRRFLGQAAWSYEADPRERRDDVGFRCVWTSAPADA